MNKKNNRKKKGSLDKGYIIRNVITALAVINLVLLFGFNYNVPGISKIITAIENKRDHIDGITASGAEASVADSNVTFEFEDPLTYAGKGNLDVVSDVTVKDAEGNELDKSGLSANITGDADKEIDYTYSSADGQYYGSAVRGLELDGYEGPSITINGDMPTLTDDNLAKVSDLCMDLCTALDGFGHDIHSQLTITAVPTEDYDGTFVIKFSATNIFADTVQAEANTKTDFKNPHLKLSAEEVTVNRGDAFDPAGAILYAVDKDGSNLLDQVEIGGEVDTTAAGDYTLTYDLTNDDGQSVKTKELIVHVVE